MKVFTLSISISLLSLFWFMLPGCNQSQAWQNESVALLQEAESIEQQYTRLNAKVDSLWDTTTEALSAALPDDFPPTDREIFLHARNADHIRMFMSFELLDTETQAMVNAAGLYDEMLAAELKSLQVHKQEFEKRKLQFLSKINEQDKEASLEYAVQFRMAAAGQTE